MHEILSRCELFAGLTPEETAGLLAGTGTVRRAETGVAAPEMQSYSRGDIIALQGARYDRLLIVVEGSLTAEVEVRYRSGGSMSVERMDAPSVVAPSYLYAGRSVLPATLVACSAATVLSIDRDRFTAMLAGNARLLNNFLRMVSSSNSFASDRVVYLTYPTIKSRYANYLLALADRQQSATITNTLTQREMADMFGVTRPALARAVGEMVAEGAVFVRGKQISILFAEKLRQYARPQHGY